MNENFDINGTKIKGGCQLGRKVVPHDSKSDLPLVENILLLFDDFFCAIKLHQMLDMLVFPTSRYTYSSDGGEAGFTIAHPVSDH